MDETKELVIELVIQDLSRGGAGVGRDQGGRAIFVHGTAPGDRVRARVTEEKKRYAQAELLEVLEASPVRVAPRCAVFGRCGGCQWQHLPYELQWSTKVQGALHALRRVGFEGVEQLSRDEYPASTPWNYRNRVQLRGGNHGVGFYARGSHSVVPIDRCEIAREEINQEIAVLSKEALSRAKPSKVEVEVLDTGEVRSVWNSKHGALGFRQVNDEQNSYLKAWIGQALKPSQGLGGLLLDLYGGFGNLSRDLAPSFARVQCVDWGARRDGSDYPAHFEIFSEDVLRWVRQELRAGRSESPMRLTGGAVILDPPREGCGDVLREISELVDLRGLRQWVAVGCDPDSWAKDLWRKLRFDRDTGWKIDRLAFFDFFPHTPHLESVALLSRV